jgi:hypothetical protein
MSSSTKALCVLLMMIAATTFTFLTTDRYLRSKGIENLYGIDNQYITLTVGCIVGMITFYSVIYIYSTLNLRAIQRILK